MKSRALRVLCMTLPGATEQIQWENDRVFKVGGKMFACSGLEADSCYSFKVDDERFLRDGGDLGDEFVQVCVLDVYGPWLGLGGTRRHRGEQHAHE